MAQEGKMDETTDFETYEKFFDKAESLELSEAEFMYVYNAALIRSCKAI